MSQTAKATAVYFTIRARLNDGATLEEAVKGAIRECGPLRTIRVSSAQAKGTAKQYAYYGAVRYELRIARAGHLTNVARERASSDRRSARLAESDADKIALSEDRAGIGAIGAVSAQLVARSLGI